MDQVHQEDEEEPRVDPVREVLRQLLLVLVLIGTVSGVIGTTRGGGFLVLSGTCLLAAIACFVAGMRRMDRG